MRAPARGVGVGWVGGRSPPRISAGIHARGHFDEAALAHADAKEVERRAQEASEGGGGRGGKRGGWGERGGARDGLKAYDRPYDSLKAYEHEQRQNQGDAVVRHVAGHTKKDSIETKTRETHTQDRVGL